MARLVTYLDLASIFKIQRSGFDFKSNVTSAIGYSANRGFLASYVSRRKAMAYDRNRLSYATYVGIQYWQKIVLIRNQYILHTYVRT